MDYQFQKLALYLIFVTGSLDPADDSYDYTG